MHGGRRNSDMFGGDVARTAAHTGRREGLCVPMGSTDRVLSISKGRDALYQLEESVHSATDMEMVQKKGFPR